MNLKKDVKELIYVLLLAAVLFFFLNLEYFWKNIVFDFRNLRSPTAQQALDDLRQQQGPAYDADTLYIESLDVKAPVQYVDQASEAVFQKALINGVVHYPGTAMPGQLGNVYIFGHSSDNPWSTGHYKTVFALLPRIGAGAKIILTDSSGQPFIYDVTQSFVTGKSDVQWLDQGNYQRRLLTLQTSYPIGTSLRRWIVIAELAQ